MALVWVKLKFDRCYGFCVYRYSPGQNVYVYCVWSVFFLICMWHFSTLCVIDIDFRVTSSYLKRFNTPIGFYRCFQTLSQFLVVSIIYKKWNKRSLFTIGIYFNNPAKALASLTIRNGPIPDFWTDTDTWYLTPKRLQSDTSTGSEPSRWQIN